MPLSKTLRFRLWHLFALVAIVALGMWLIAQVGLETAEIEILQFDTWPRTGVAENDSRIEVVNVKFKYVSPEELSNTSLILFFGDSSYTQSNKIGIGTRIKFRYRAKPMMWFNPQQPDPIAFRSLGLDPNDIEEIITEVNLPTEK